MFTIQEHQLPLLRWDTILMGILCLIFTVITILIWYDFTNDVWTKLKFTLVEVFLVIGLVTRINSVKLTLVHNNEPLNNITIVNSFTKLFPSSYNLDDVIDYFNTQLTTPEKENIVRLNKTGKKYTLEIKKQRETVEKEHFNGRVVQHYTKITYVIEEVN